jgi:hypothetical protein
MTFSVSHYATIAQIIAPPPRLRNPPLKKTGQAYRCRDLLPRQRGNQYCATASHAPVCH